MKNAWPVLMLFGLISSGYARADSHEQPCEKIQKLIADYDNGFQSVMGTRRATARMDIWQTNYHLVGNACEIWGWGSGKKDYMCSRTFPSQAIAEDRFKEVKTELQACLTGWQITEQGHQSGTGKKVVFQLGDRVPAVSLHVVNTQGLFKSEWSAYVFVGDTSNKI